MRKQRSEIWLPALKQLCLIKDVFTTVSLKFDIHVFLYRVENKSLKEYNSLEPSLLLQHEKIGLCYQSPTIKCNASSFSRKLNNYTYSNLWLIYISVHKVYNLFFFCKIQKLYTTRRINSLTPQNLDESGDKNISANLLLNFPNALSITIIMTPANSVTYFFFASFYNGCWCWWYKPYVLYNEDSH